MLLENRVSRGLPVFFFHRLTHASGQVPTALAVDDDLNLVAVGFDNGTLILLRGDLRRDRGAKQKTLLTGGSSGLSGSIVGVSGLAFRASKLYAATSTEVLLFNVKDKDKESCHQLDDIGCELGEFYTAVFFISFHTIINFL